MKRGIVIYLILVVLFCPISAVNLYNHVYNGSSWVPALATADGQQKYWMQMNNATYGNVIGNLTIGEMIGIGTMNPTHELNVVGDANITGDLYVNSSSIYLGDKKISVVNNELTFNDINITPPGMIAIFNGSCPVGWHEVNETRGRYVVGVPDGGVVGLSVGTNLSDGENREVGEHSHGSSGLTFSGSDTLDHSHGDSFSASTTRTGSSTAGSSGSHVHSVDADTSSYSAGVAGGLNFGQEPTSHLGYSDFINSAGSHTHSVTGGSWSTFLSGSVSSANLPAPSGTIGGSTANSGSVSSTNAPYIQMTYCEKDLGSDYAEWIESDEKIEEGMIVSVDVDNDKKVVRSRKEYDDKIIGVVSTKPGWLIGRESRTAVKLALAGRVPVKVSLINGEIKRGDAITSSSVEGFGMRADVGRIVGIALSELNENSGGVYECGENLCGEVEILLDLSWRSDNNKLLDKIKNIYDLVFENKRLILEQRKQISELKEVICKNNLEEKICVEN